MLGFVIGVVTGFLADRYLWPLIWPTVNQTEVVLTNKVKELEAALIVALDAAKKKTKK